MLIQDNATVLFQGDSITDTGRSRENDTDLGRGYANMVAAWFSAMHPASQVSFINRGIGGNRAIDLQGRWQADCLDLKPTWVSILIGINDTWRRYDRDDPTSTDAFEAAYRHILTQLADTSTAGIILCEPFVLPTPADRVAWRIDLDPKIHVVRQLAREFKAVFVPLDGVFAQAATVRPPEFWTADGVHPTQAGHALIAQAWLRAVLAD